LSTDRFPMVSLGIFSVVHPTEPCALRSTQPLKVSTRDFSWGKVGLNVWLKTYHPWSVETSRKSGALIYPEPLEPSRAVAGWPLLYPGFPQTNAFYCLYHFSVNFAPIYFKNPVDFGMTCERQTNNAKPGTWPLIALMYKVVQIRPGLICV